MQTEIYFSIDVETSGPIPGEYNMLSIGACVVGDPAKRFYVELVPLNENFTDEAMLMCGATLAEFQARGIAPHKAMTQFGNWVRVNAHGMRPIFVGFNAPFDWSFVNYYFVKFLGVKQNPFGHSALDIKSYYMGAYGTTFLETSMRRMPPEIHSPDTPLSHNALEDAIQQAEIFERLLRTREKRMETGDWRFSPRSPISNLQSLVSMPTFSSRLLRWFDTHKRALPWRETRDPYRIWLSEILLQQTRVEAVIPYYEKFLARYPDVFALARAPLDDVLKTWEGAGYYARARNLHRTAQIVAYERGGTFPQPVDDLMQLPGIGRYTAGAIASIAFDVRAPAVDGNVVRVLCRYCGIRDDPKASATQTRLWELAASLLPKKRAGDFNQALMELGATICVPKNPRCLLCPLQKDCFARADALQNVLPLKRAKQLLPHKIIAAGVIYKRGKILIQQRLNQGLLGGLWEFPGGKVEAGESLAECVARECREELGIAVRVGEKIISVDHAFSHFSITLHAFRCEYISGRVKLASAQKYKWVRPEDLEQYAFPAANKKIIAALLLPRTAPAANPPLRAARTKTDTMRAAPKNSR